MDANDKRIFADALIAMAEVYGKEITASLAMLYFDDLSEYPLAQVLSAFSAHRKDRDRGRWFPKVADLIDKLEGAADERGMVAWAALLPMLQDSARARSDDPITERVVKDLGGWLRLGHTSVDKLVWVEKEFVRRYQMYSEHGANLQLENHGLNRIGKLVE